MPIIDSSGLSKKAVDERVGRWAPVHLLGGRQRYELAGIALSDHTRRAIEMPPTGLVQFSDPILASFA